MTVPTNSTLTIHKQTVMVHPIIDEYYNNNPYHSRSSKLVRDRGLTGDEKTRPNLTPENSILPAATARSLHDIVATTLTPSMHAGSPLSPPTDPAYHQASADSDIRQLSSIKNTNTTPNKTQEQGNTKKKRRSLSNRENQIQEIRPESEAEHVPEVRAIAYGDPMKIAQYFPELH